MEDQDIVYVNDTVNMPGDTLMERWDTFQGEEQIWANVAKETSRIMSWKLHSRHTLLLGNKQ